MSLKHAAETPLRRRRGWTGIPELLRLCLMVLLFHGFVAEHAKGEVRHGEAAEDDQQGEEHGFVGDGLDEGVEDFRERVGGHFGAGDFHGVLRHFLCPGVAGDVEGWCAWRVGAAVRAEMLCCYGDLGHDACAGFEGFPFNVALDGGVE